MQDILPVAISGLVSGSAYALIALGIVIIYRSTHTTNFAIGDMGTLAVYVAVTAISAGVSIYLSLIISVVFAGLLGILVERFLIRPLGRDKSIFIALVVTIGVSLIIHAVISGIWGYDSMRIKPMATGFVRVSGVVISWNKIVAMCIAFAAMAAVAWFFAFTATGIAMRASAEDPRGAAVVGIPPNRLTVIAWFIGCSLGAIAAFFLASESSVHASLAVSPLFRAFAGVFLGGLTSMAGAASGAFIIGVLDNLAGSFISSDFRDTIVFSIIILVLFIRPSGFLGTARKERV